MKKGLLLLVLLIVTGLVNAQSKKEKQVASAVEVFRLAMISGEKNALESIAAGQLKYGHSGGKIENKTEFVESFTSGRSDFVTNEFTDIVITVSGKTAIVTFMLNAKTNDNNKPGEVHLKIMTTWQKQKGSWKLLARQAVKIVK